MAGASTAHRHSQCEIVEPLKALFNNPFVKPFCQGPAASRWALSINYCEQLVTHSTFSQQLASLTPWQLLPFKRIQPRLARKVFG